MTHGCERWNQNHTNYITTAFFNGVGFNAWENVWGVYNKIVDRDAELLRRASKMQRFLFSFFMGKNGKTQDPGEVFYNYDPSESDTFLEDGVYASRFESTASGKARGSIYQLVNRVGADKTVQFQPLFMS